jgi:hypothetical protein
LGLQVEQCKQEHVQKIAAKLPQQEHHERTPREHQEILQSLIFIIQNMAANLQQDYKRKLEWESKRE